MGVGATEEQIAAAEARLGVHLPPSYRAFLAEPPEAEPYLPVGDVDWFRTREADWLTGFLEGVRADGRPGPMPDEDPTDPARFRFDQLGGTLAITETVDQRIFLLNPAVISADGEWEAWDFANWYPGAYRFSTFAELRRSAPWD